MHRDKKWDARGCGRLDRDEDRGDGVGTGTRMGVVIKTCPHAARLAQAFLVDLTRLQINTFSNTSE